jgi:ribonuclease J
VISSAQNIDRLVTVYRAATRAGRIFVTDLYAASIAKAIGRDTIPQPGFNDYRVYVPNRQRVQIKESAEFDRISGIASARVFPEWLSEHATELVLLLPSSTVPELLRTGVLRDGVVVWSLWPGYLNDPSGRRLQALLEEAGVPLVLDHASGHAPVVDLQRLADALNPTRLVPIHTEASDRYDMYFNNVERHHDGEWWVV